MQRPGKGSHLCWQLAAPWRQQGKWGFLGCRDPICKVWPRRLAKFILTFWDIPALTFAPNPKILYKEKSNISFHFYSDGFPCFMHLVERFFSHGNTLWHPESPPLPHPISHWVMGTVVQEHHLSLLCDELASQPKPPLLPHSKSQAVPVIHHTILAVGYLSDL